MLRVVAGSLALAALAATAEARHHRSGSTPSVPFELVDGPGGTAELVPETSPAPTDCVSLAETVCTTDTLSLLCAALQATDLADLPDNITVFAPTDAAFLKLAVVLGIVADDLLTLENLEQVLLYHVVPGVFFAADLFDGELLETADAGCEVEITVERSGSIFVNQAEVVLADIEGCEGVAHVIDSVLLPDCAPTPVAPVPEPPAPVPVPPPAPTFPPVPVPPTPVLPPVPTPPSHGPMPMPMPEPEPECVSIVDAVCSSPDLTILCAAIEAAGLTGGDFDNDTLFAPTNAAFLALVEELGVEPSELLESPELLDILLYHALDTVEFAADLAAQNGDLLTTLEGCPVQITVTPRGNIYVNQAKVIQADIVVCEGVGHIIDSVLIPTCNAPPSHGPPPPPSHGPRPSPAVTPAPEPFPTTPTLPPVATTESPTTAPTMPPPAPPPPPPSPATGGPAVAIASQTGGGSTSVSQIGSGVKIGVNGIVVGR